MVLATALAILLPHLREMSINHDPPGLYSGNPPSLGLSVPPKEPDARSSVVADVPSSFPMQSPVQYTQDAADTNNYQDATASQVECLHALAHYTPSNEAGAPLAPHSAHYLGSMLDVQATASHTTAHYMPSEVVNPLPKIDTHIPGSMTDKQLALFHTAALLRLGGPSAKARLGRGSLDHLMEAKHR